MVPQPHPDLATLRQAEHAEDPALSRVFDHWLAGQSALAAHALDDAEDHYRQMITAPKEQRCPATDVLGLCGMARINAQRGLWGPAEEMLDRAQQASQGVTRIVLGWVHITAARITRPGGNPSRVLDAWRGAVDAFRDGEAWTWAADAVEGLIPACIAAGQPTSAVSTLQLLPDASGTEIGTRLTIGRAEVAEALGDVRRALRLTESLPATQTSDHLAHRLAALRIRCAGVTGEAPPKTTLPDPETASATGIQLLLNATAARLASPSLATLQTRAEQLQRSDLAAMAAGLSARDAARANDRDAAIFHLTNAERMAQVSNHAGCQLRTARQRAQIELNLGLGTPVRIRSLLQVHLEMARVSGDTLAEVHARLLLAQCVPAIPDEAAATHAAAALNLATQHGYQPLVQLASALAALFDSSVEIRADADSGPLVQILIHMAHLSRCTTVTDAVDRLRETHQAIQGLGTHPPRALSRVLRHVMHLTGLQMLAEGTGSDLVIDAGSGQFWIDGEPLVQIKPSSIPFRLLRTIAIEGSRIDKATLFERAWEQAYRPPSSDNTLYVNLHRLRGKIADRIAIDPTEDGGYAIRGRPNVFQWFDEPIEQPLNPFPTVSPTADPPEVQDTNSNIPAAKDAFIGRRKETAALSQQYGTGCRLVTLTGPKGVGKSRLARQLGRDRAERGTHAGGVWLADVAQATDLDGFLVAVAKALDVPLTGEDKQTPANQLTTEFTARGEVMLILDGVDGVTSELGELIEQWLWTAPRLRILITGTEPLKCASERRVVLDPLPEEDAIVLFEQRARQVRPGFQLMDRIRSTVVGLVRTLDCLPLTIELAAARMDLVDAETLHAQLTQWSVAQEDSDPTALGTVRWSLGLLSEWERATLAQCSIFQGGFSTKDAQAIVRLDNPDAPWVGELIDALQRRALLQQHQDPASTSTRFTLLPAAVPLVQPLIVDLEALETRHADHTISQGEARLAGRFGPGGPTCWLQLRGDLQNALAVIERFRGRDLERAARATLIASAVLCRTGPMDRLHELLDQTAQVHTALDPRLALRVLLRQAEHAVPGQPDRAVRALELASERAQQVTDERWLGQLAYTHGWAWMHQPGRLADAEVAFEQARTLIGTAGFTAGTGLVLQRLAQIHHQRGDTRHAVSLLEEAVSVHESIGDVLHLAPALSHLGACEHSLGLDSATRHLQQALSLAQEHTDVALIGTTHDRLATAFHSRWRIDAARYHFEQASEFLRRAGQQRQSAIARSLLGVLSAGQGNQERARYHLRQAQTRLTAAGATEATGRVVAQLAQVHLDTSDTQTAEELCAEAERMLTPHSKASGVHPGLRALRAAIALDAGDTTTARREWSALPHATEDPICRAQLAWIDHQEGNMEAARSGYAHSLDALRENTFERILGRIYLRLACLHAQQGDEEAACEAMGQAHSQFEATQDLVGMRNLEVLQRCGMPLASQVASAAQDIPTGGLEQRLLLRSFQGHQ